MRMIYREDWLFMSAKMDKIICNRFQKVLNCAFWSMPYQKSEQNHRNMEDRRMKQQNDQRDCHRKLCFRSKLWFPADMLIVGRITCILASCALSTRTDLTYSIQLNCSHLMSNDRKTSMKTVYIYNNLSCSSLLCFYCHWNHAFFIIINVRSNTCDCITHHVVS